ncbi:3-isopropylmalate dehydratase [Pyrolobus fumarii 1A]|uniref:3-isopropylmalate dehydratase large subunit n=1 Tax=Pyrolobus fumarii (strain DSM 11204 / 1A) TaxID=694429 RepID=G0EE17_PYRF1|nr:3-isopropylmalate dehydratase large subunit [Pyrolobus fumarii]AEM37933.1 3-isopropylmalate dehydratase [Pyrolobus fumarii 1A]
MRGTLTELILSKHVKEGRVEPGEVITARVDRVIFHDLTGYHVIEVMEKAGKTEPWDPSKIVVAFDHLVPAPTVRAAEVQKKTREWALKHGVIFRDVGHGILHQVVVDEGLVEPGQVVIGADSHTNTAGAVGAFATGMGASDVAYAALFGEVWMRVPEPIRVELKGSLKPPVTTKDLVLKMLGDHGAGFANYKALEFVGEAVKTLSIEDRMTVANMTTEMGAKVGLFPSDEVTIDYYQSLGKSVKRLEPAPNAEYTDTLEYDLSSLEPMVAVPPRVDNVKPVTEVEGVEVDQVFIGSCTNGRLSDLEAAARILKGRKVHPRVRCIVIAASRKIYEEALKRGIVEVLTEAGCLVTWGTCGPCIGGHYGVLGPDEVGVFTSNRNFRGRTGHPTAKTYLASPYVAAASAIEGKIADPRRYL